MKKYTFSLLLIFLAGIQLHSQKTIKGIIRDHEGQPLSGAVIQIKNTQTAVLSDANGNFKIEVPATATALLVSYVGFKTTELNIERISGDVEVKLEYGLELSQTIVTALGINREKKSLGYSVQKLNGEDLANNRDQNLLSTLQGKVAGMQVISAAGQVGASARVVIRGNSSISGNNQPLFVVNGVPIDNSSFSALGLYGGIDWGNALSDVSADDIDNVSVLKGPAATALYGSRAANGVVLITTKTAKSKSTKGLGVSYSANIGFTSTLRFWDLQTKYGQGSNQQFKYVDGSGTASGNLNDNAGESWGPAFDYHINEKDSIDNDGNGIIDEPGEGQFIDQYTGKHQPWKAAPPIPNSLDIGLDITNNIAITSNGDHGNLRFSYTNYLQKGMIPNTELQRNSFNLSFNNELSKKWHTDGNINYIRTDSKNRPGIGYAGGFFYLALFNGQQVDWRDLRNNWNTKDQYGRDYNFLYDVNPFWDVYRQLKPLNRDRVNGFYSITYDVKDWLKVTGRISTDFYREHHEIQNDWTVWGHGSFQDDDFFVNERNADILLTAKHSLGDHISLLATAGANRLDQTFRSNSVVLPALVQPSIFNVSNSDGNAKVTTFNSQKRINSMYASASIGYNNWLFFDLTGRNDWSSALPTESNSYFYPSANLGLILSDALHLSHKIDFLKVRAGWAQVGSDTDPYRLRQVLAANVPFNAIPTYSVPDIFPNAALKPEIKSSFETGVEFLAFNRRLGLDLSWYDSRARDQILPVDVSPATGYATHILNAGTVQNTGIELQLTGTPIVNRNFNWSVTLNWARNRSKVYNLPKGVDAIVLGNDGGCLVVAREGEEYGSIYSTQPLRNAEGKLILKDGLDQVDPAGNVKQGTITPRWTGGISNTFKYKDFSLSFLIDGRFGNKFLSWSYIFLRSQGLAEETLEGRNTVDEIKNGYAFDGVIDNGDGTYRPNDVKVSAQTWNAHYYPFGGGSFARSIFDGSFVKLREINVSWILPERIYSKLHLKSMNVGLYMRNVLFLYTGQKHFDPEFQFTANNGDQGFEVAQHPPTRTIGFKLNVEF